VTPARRSVFKSRGAQLAKDHQSTLEQSRADAAVGWISNQSRRPGCAPRLYEQIRNEDWALCNGTVFQNYWPQQLWTATRHYQYIATRAHTDWATFQGRRRRRTGAQQTWTACGCDRAVTVT